MVVSVSSEILVKRSARKSGAAIVTASKNVARNMSVGPANSRVVSRVGSVGLDIIVRVVE